ncbi:MAG: LacI family DNA-binding transcriptional regulator [Gammaproteobacteria bacterium]
MNILTNETNKATIIDVANMARVSIKTVSRVANGEPNVRDKTRAKVQRAIDLLGYSANPYARKMGSQSRPPERVRSRNVISTRERIVPMEADSQDELMKAGIETVGAQRAAAIANRDGDIDWW